MGHQVGFALFHDLLGRTRHLEQLMDGAFEALRLRLMLPKGVTQRGQPLLELEDTGSDTGAEFVERRCCGAGDGSDLVGLGAVCGRPDVGVSDVRMVLGPPVHVPTDRARTVGG